jgi:hypothetical protein
MNFKPMLDDFALELLAGQASGVEKSIVEYEVPFADGAILDDMGVKARRFQIKTIWRRENYEAYPFFLEHVKLDRLNSFVHPDLGLIRGRIRSASVARDDRLCAEIDIEFIEDANPDAAPAYDPPLVANLEDGFNKSSAALMDSAAAELGAAGIDPSAEIDPEKPISEQVPARTVSARALVARIEMSVAALRGAFDTVLNPVESAVGMFSYGLSLPGAMIGAVARAAERAALVAGGAANAPVMFAASLRGNVSRLLAAVPAMAGQITVAAANIAALVAGEIFAADESRKAVLRRIEDAPQWRPDGTRADTPPAPRVLTAGELDESLGRIREMIFDGAAAARALGCAPAVPVLARQAAELARYVNAVKLERDRMISVEAEDATPLHLICLRHGLPYSYADRICTINSFRNPTFCVGQVRVYERRQG